MNFQILDIQNKHDFDYVLALYLVSFPPSERRTVLDMISLIKTNPCFKIYLIYDNNKRVGFISLWTFKEFVYLEHFAINSTLRNGGYGKKFLQCLKLQNHLPMVGEIELPTSSEIAARRKSFYERQGFTIWENIDYAQPNFVEGDPAVPMLLISYGDINENFIERIVIETLFKEVYKSK